MKLTTGILGCALVAGLMTFAPSQSQAGVVGPDGVLYSPLNLKLSVTTQNSKGKFTKTSISSKEVLKDLNYSSDVVLTVSLINGDIVVVNKKSGEIISNLTSNKVMTIYIEEKLSNPSSKDNGQFTYDSTGTIEINFESMDAYFDVKGSYTASFKGNKVDKNGDQNVTTKGDSKDLSGVAYIVGVTDDNTVATGSGSVKGNGKIDPATLPF